MGVGSSRHSMSSSRRACWRWRVALTALGIVAGCVVWSSSALALTQRGHVFDFAFGNAGSEGELSNPAGVAVDEATHEVYVVDRGKEQVDRFTCNPGPCKFASAFAVRSPESIAVDNAPSSPTNQSQGDVYVSSMNDKGPVPKGSVFKFSSTGTLLASTSAAEGIPLEQMLGLAVTASGELWVEQGAESPVIYKASGATPKKIKLSSESLEVVHSHEHVGHGLAVDSNESFYVTSGEFGEVFEVEEVEEESAEADCALAPCVVTKVQTKNAKGEEEVEPLIAELLSANTTGLAVDLFGPGVFANDVYIDNGTHVSSLTAAGALIQEFGAAEPAQGFAGLQQGTGVAVDSSTGEVYVADAGTDTIDVFGLEPKGAPKIDSVSAAEVTSTTAKLSAEIDPTGVETEYKFEYSTSTPVDCSSASSSPCEAPIPEGRLEGVFEDKPASAEIANLQPGTEYHIRVIATQEGGAPVISRESTLITPVASGEGLLPDGRHWEMVSPLEKQGAGIVPPTGSGSAVQAAANGEAISYFALGPIEAEPHGNRNPEVTQVLAKRGAGGWTDKDISTTDETSHGPENTDAEYRVFSPDLALALVYPFPGNSDVTRFAEPALSPSLSSPGELEEVREKTPYLRDDGLPSEASTEAIYAQARKNGEAMGEGPDGTGFLALINAKDDTAKSEYGQANGQAKTTTEGATSDLGHVAIGAAVPLTSSDPSAPANTLYLWSEGALPVGEFQLVSRLPSGTVAPEGGVLGSKEFRQVRNAISGNGARVFWSASHHLYMWSRATERSIQLDVPQAGAGQEAPDAEFAIASTDGSKVYFTDTQRLTTDASPRKADLYECEIAGTEEAPACNLSDVTPAPATAGENAAVQGTVLGASEDGSRLFFVANGVLASNESSHGETPEPGSCAPVVEEKVAGPVGATCNLYMSVPGPNPGEHVTTFIARLSNEDAPDWESTENGLAFITSRLSPNAQHLAFMSERSLTGYENADVDSNNPDEEVFLYNVKENSTVCVSCNPTGARPTGIFDQSGGGLGIGPLVDREDIWSTEKAGIDHWLAGSVASWDPIDNLHALYQPRYLSDDGRVFFNSSDALVPQATNHKEDVYEYEPEGEVGAGGQVVCSHASATYSEKSGGCVSLISSGTSSQESVFLDASESGGDAFFLTEAGLVPQDTDESYDVYDARECGSSCLPPQPPKSSPCHDEQECLNAPASPPSFSAPASVAFSGAGNVVPSQQALPFKTTVKPPTKAQLLAKALAACKKHKQKAKRIACERQARRRYGAKQAKKATVKHAKASKRRSRS
jgi:DNA-binding beta-propeller fold protein YncE